jgi:hypothetical protein
MNETLVHPGTHEIVDIAAHEKKFLESMEDQLRKCACPVCCMVLANFLTEETKHEDVRRNSDDIQR